MIMFATSDKGGTGRSVTSCNLGYRLSSRGRRVAYLDFDFGSPTAGALFELGGYERGVAPVRPQGAEAEHGQGLHSYLLGTAGTPARVNVRDATDREDMRRIRGRGGQLVLFPGDQGGGEFDRKKDADVISRCVRLLREVDEQFDVSIVDLSAGRSLAMDIVLSATADKALKDRTVRWLVFHRWTRQHIYAANSLVYGPHGLLECGRQAGHGKELLKDVRFVRTVVPQVDRLRGGSAPQAAWLHQQDRILNELAGELRVGASALLGTIPVEPMLQWREQLILDVDVQREIANRETVEAFDLLAEALLDARMWGPD
ncbi:hypothetical protein IT779_05380 [Nocardia sp. NEAU-351]|uniref:CobQ/CobB/MinD/ParA nucleotide binding domain-containing protein n=2 Tax=Nocardia bovistercoris TaxID=2785916 RepID=A0A931N269_9NOCA|nr:hypothetical protein [Nocardia bovistercoris]